MKRIVPILNRPLFGTCVIPPGARVDVAQFPEEEFPVSCPKCEYLLRGLPDGRCPECGEPFERGRLLVVEYAEWRTSRQKRYDRLVARLSIVGLVLVVGGSVVGYFVQRYLAALAADPKAAVRLPPLMDQMHRLTVAWTVVQVVVTGILIALAVFGVVHYRRRAGRRRKVIAALQVPEAQSLCSAEEGR